MGSYKKQPIGPDDDPIAVMFGEDSHAKLIRMDDDEINIPDEVQILFEEQKLSKRKFACTLRNAVGGTNAHAGGYIRGWDRQVPTIDWIAQNYGPGDYSLSFTWRGADPETKKTRSFIESIYITIDEKYRDQYEKLQMKRQIELAKEKRAMLEKAKISRSLETTLFDDGRGGNGKELAISYVNEVSELAEKLGWKNSGGNNIGDVLKACVPFIPAIVGFLNNQAQAARERDERFLTLLVSMSSQSNNQMLEILKTQSANNDGGHMMKKMSDMVMSAIDLKEAINPEKQSTIDKIVEIVTSVAPVVLGMATMNKQQRERHPMYGMAKSYVNNSPEFQQMQNDPDVLQGVIQRLDSYYGTEQTNGILSVAGLQRPAGDETQQETDGENPLQQAAG